ncbi:hypothetical protein [Aestuariibius sp. HNIBRBA575]|uniref:hypothetical protein n=1 Tax=Aestuariibius sp. HNIBRBA575 TaxID=3233343 RepID=UPI0034A1A386
MANERGMLRFSSVFYRHWAVLLRNKQQYPRARETVENSIATARQSKQRNILNNALLARIQIDLADQSIEPKGYKKQIEKIIADSRRLGMPRIETEALRIYAQMILAENDRVLAGKYAAEAAAVANRSGLRLHKLSALYVYGDALIKREQFDFARDLLGQTSRESERRSYHSLMSRISEISRFIPA